MKKRQEIGRGLRICVDKNGNRIKEDKKNIKINRLTIIANENYEDFSNALQKEMENESGKKISNNDIKNIIKNRNDSTLIKRNDNIENDLFKKLWNKISYKSYYKINHKNNLFSTQNIINFINQEDFIKIIKDFKINKINILKTKTITFNENNKLNDIELSQTSTGRQLENSKKNSINLTKVVNEISLNTGILNTTIYDILNGIDKEYKEYLFINENDFINKMSYYINKYIEDMFEENILEYTHTNDNLSIDIFEKEYITYVNTIYQTTGFSGKVLYDNIIFESEVERNYIDILSKDENVKFFLKLPREFKINTLLNEKYNPDWAIVYQENEGEMKIFYLIRETKSIDKNKKPILDEFEKVKVHCGKLHFALNNMDYKIVETIIH